MTLADENQVRKSSYLGLQVSRLDSIECYLTYEGTVKLHACQRGLDHWPRNANEVPCKLRIDSAFVSLFQRYCLACFAHEAVWVLREHLTTCAPYLWDWSNLGETVGSGLCRCRHVRRYSVAETREVVYALKALVVRANHILRLPGKRQLEYKDDRDRDGDSDDDLAPKSKSRQRPKQRPKQPWLKRKPPNAV